MLLIEYIEHHYGQQRGNKAQFLRDNPTILPQELTRWIRAGLKVNVATGDIYKPTSKPLQVVEKPEASHQLSPETRTKLKSCAEQWGLEADSLIDRLLDDESDRHQILRRIENRKEVIENRAPFQVLAEIINRQCAVLSQASEIDDYQMMLDQLIHELLEKKLIQVRVLEKGIAESQRLNIPRTAYYWYGGVIADGVAKRLGAFEVYLWHEILATESEVVFLGSPNNVVVCYLLCDRLCRLLKKTKSAYKKDQGKWGSKAEIEETANHYVYRFAQGIMDSDIYIYDEDSQMRLIEYADEKYRYAMD